jgi:hypothetical protein
MIIVIIINNNNKIHVFWHHKIILNICPSSYGGGIVLYGENDLNEEPEVPRGQAFLPYDLSVWFFDVRTAPLCPYHSHRCLRHL